jgi:hypothetical protein
MQRSAQVILVVVGLLVSLGGAPARAVTPGPSENVTSLFVPITGTVPVLNDTGTPVDTVTLSGEVHVLTRVAVSDTGLLSATIYVNLTRVDGTGATTGLSYVGVGAVQTTWSQTPNGPPQTPPLRLTFALVPLGTPGGIAPGPSQVPPGPSQLPAVLILQFGADGTLTAVVQASFCSASIPAGGCP